MNPLIRRAHVSSAALALALLQTSPFAASAAPPTARVSASQAAEAAVVISFVNPHRPQLLAEQGRALANDLNAERVKRGVAALVADDSLNRFAYAKAVGMASRGYFGHTDLDGVTFADRLRAWNWPTLYAAENIAYDCDELHAHMAFMRSAGHAANVLDPNEHRMGIAVVTVGANETFYVEVFSS